MREYFYRRLYGLWARVDGYLKWIEVTSISTDKHYMKQKLGKTGLTQKEAIYQIICKVLGPRMQPGVEVEDLIAKKDEGYIQPRWNSPELLRMIDLVSAGLVDGTIPSKYNSKSNLKEIKEYSNRITHYWLRHDRRLNGGFSGTRVSKKKQRAIVLQTRIKYDPHLKALKHLYKQSNNEVDKLEIESLIKGRTFSIVLDVFGVDKSEIPLSLKVLLKIEESTQADSESKAA